MGGVSKQHQRLLGTPVAVYTLKAFENCPRCTEIIVVSKADECTLFESYKKEYGFEKLKCVLPGGSSRQESAFIGMKAIDEKIAYIAIHDAARALITPAQIKEVIMSAYAHGAAIAATPATDTIKYAEGVTIGETVPREKIWLAQTPQVFRDEIYRAAAYTAEKEGFIATDDASLVENIGKTVYLVDTGSDNFKVTYKTDLIRAEQLLLERKENEKCE